MVYAGGRFTSVAGRRENTSPRLMRRPRPHPTWDPNANDADRHPLGHERGTLYAGGWFTSVGGQSRNQIAALDAATGAATTGTRTRRITTCRSFPPWR